MARDTTSQRYREKEQSFVEHARRFDIGKRKKSSRFHFAAAALSATLFASSLALQNADEHKAWVDSGLNETIYDGSKPVRSQDILEQSHTAYSSSIVAGRWATGILCLAFAGVGTARRQGIGFRPLTQTNGEVIQHLSIADIKAGLKDRHYKEFFFDMTRKADVNRTRPQTSETTADTNVVSVNDTSKNLQALHNLS